MDMINEHDFDGHGGCVPECRACCIQALRARLAKQDADLAQAYAQLQWIGECVEGQDVSAFAESFPLIRAVADLRAASFRPAQKDTSKKGD